MPEANTSPWPEDVFDFAFLPGTDDRLADLKTLAEPEDWTYEHTHSDHPYPILFNYIRYTYRRIAEENKIALSEDGQFSCFNTGLVTPNQEPIYASFETNRKEGAQPWFFKNWFRRGEWNSTSSPTCLILPITLTIQHASYLTAERISGLISSTLSAKRRETAFLNLIGRWKAMRYKRF
ncbi:MAG: DUF3825 domain-containing protein [Nitrospira sp.]|nr:DUF3825 domain-containing protein [Nitrospira sp.]